MSYSRYVHRVWPSGQVTETRAQGLFAFVASHLVRQLARYAAGSGISEIKCILAGFVMHGFLGFSTFVVKSLTLVSVLSQSLG